MGVSVYGVGECNVYMMFVGLLVGVSNCACWVVRLWGVYCTMIPGNSIGAEDVKALVPVLNNLSQLRELNLSCEL